MEVVNVKQKKLATMQGIVAGVTLEFLSEKAVCFAFNYAISLEIGE